MFLVAGSIEGGKKDGIVLLAALLLDYFIFFGGVKLKI